MNSIVNEPASKFSTLGRDMSAGVVVFLVALPLCMGIALASGAPPFSGLLAGIIGGIVVGVISGSHTSVSGPAAGLTAIIAAQIALLGSFEAFLTAVVIGGLIQIAMGAARLGIIAAFFPNSVIKGLLAAIGVILILKQIPHVLGHDTDPEGDMAFEQPDHHNTFTEIGTLFFGDMHMGAAIIGLLSVGILVFWDTVPWMKKSKMPAPLVVVVLGLVLSQLFSTLGERLAVGSSHLVQVPVIDSLDMFWQGLQMPDLSKLWDSDIYVAGVTIALVASLETLLNLEAVDKIDPKQRVSPGSRELIAQGIGNVLSGSIGGLPMTSVIVRSSVNINAGGQSKLSAIIHGILLLFCVMLLPSYLNLIPVSCLAAILLTTGIKLASPKLFKQLWTEGRYQFIPFIVTLVAIVLTDLLIGILIGLAVSISFILNSNFRRPLRRVLQKHIGGEVLHIELANQVSFLNRAVIEKTLREVPRNGHVLLDASRTDYIDPDILGLIRDFKENTALIHGIKLSLKGFRQKYDLQDEIQFVDFSTREVQGMLSPAGVLQVLRDGNERFRTGRQVSRDVGRQLQATAAGQHPLAVVLSCIDSRTPAELIFDLGLGDIFSIRIAGNISSPKVLGSIEYGTAVAGAKLILVVGHTRCGAVNAAVNFTCSETNALEKTGCEHLEPIVQDIRKSIDLDKCQFLRNKPTEAIEAYAEDVARKNVRRVVQQLLEESRTIKELVASRKVGLAGAMYNVSSGQIEFLDDSCYGVQQEAAPMPNLGLVAT